jgi:hypothetical protein
MALGFVGRVIYRSLVQALIPVVVGVAVGSVALRNSITARAVLMVCPAAKLREILCLAAGVLPMT